MKNKKDWEVRDKRRGKDREVLEGQRPALFIHVLIPSKEDLRQMFKFDILDCFAKVLGRGNIQMPLKITLGIQTSITDAWHTV